jgi:anti-sigma B factor antagonist
VTIQENSRQVDGVTVLAISGSMTAEGGSEQFRNAVKSLAAQGNNKVLLDLSKVDKVDSEGLGQLVSAYTTLRNAGGDLKLFNLSPEVHYLLQITKLSSVFDIQEDEASAIASFEESRGAATR